MSKIFVSLVTALVCAISSVGGATVLIDNFESYANGYSLSTGVGTTWGYVSSPNRARVTPDPLNSGYTFVMQGTHSAYMSTGATTFRDFDTVSGLSWGTSDTIVVSWLFASPEGATSGNSQSIFVSPTSGGGTGARLSVTNTGGVREFWLGGDGSLNSGVQALAGGGGVPTLNQVYRLSMAINFSTFEFEGFYEDVTNDPGVTVSLGSLGMNLFGGSVGSGINTGASYLSEGSLRFQTTSGTMAIDDINVTVVPVPEPATAGLLGLTAMGLFFVLRKKRTL